jgi:hypothetical protein
MDKIYYPVLCIQGTAEINVLPTDDKDILWRHCYELQRIHNGRIEGFWIYAVEVDNDAAFCKRIAQLDTIRMLRNQLLLETNEQYINWLFTLGSEALEVIIGELMVTSHARKN